MFVNRKSFVNSLLKRNDELSDYPSVSGIKVDTESPPNDSDDVETPPACSIPLYQTAGSRLFTLQKQIRDELAKCSRVAFIIDDINALKTIKQNIQGIHSQKLKHPLDLCKHFQQVVYMKGMR